jgi:hypothetical protein
MTAITEVDSSVFVMPKKELAKIESQFLSIYNSMEHMGIKKFKHH